MTALLDFAMLSPEVNSARMYSGAGSASMLAAASAWKGLAAELRSTALSYGAVVSALTDEEWMGPASAAMADAAAPYVAWMNTTAVQAEQAASQAEAAAAAYETAFAATVPPAEIAANRAQLVSLVSTNVLGLNTPAIAANEAQYGEMWGQDAAAMYGYAGSSAVASQLTEFGPPQPIVNPAATTAQSAATAKAAATSAGTGQSALSKMMTSVPGTLQSMATPAASTGSAASSVTGGSGLDNLLNSPIWNNFGPNATIWNTIFSSGFYMPSNFLGTATDLFQAGQGAGGAAAGAAGGAASAAEGAASAAAGLAQATTPLGNLGAVGNAVSAGLGAAPQVGGLTVPASWTGAAPQLSSAINATPMVAPPPAVAAGMPGVPMGGMGGRGFRNVPQYGFKPNFVTRPPSAG
jgi:PPE-repeat protein